ncbi:MAG: peptidoglycan-binding protein [Patescibacteria group bacterium]
MKIKMNVSDGLSRILIAIGMIAIAVVFINAPSAHAAMLTRELEVGSSGADVSALQTFLAQDRALYPQGLVTGYFGTLTKGAVINFQLRNEIPTVGRVGPMTMAVINQQMATGLFAGVGTTYTAPPSNGMDTAAAVISNVTFSTGSTNATINWNTNESAQGLVYYSSSPLPLSENMGAVSIGGTAVRSDVLYHTTHNVSLQGLNPNTLYYYLVYTTDQFGNVSVTWPSTFRTTN